MRRLWVAVLVAIPSALAGQGGALVLQGNQAGADYGRALAAGDFNGDGFGDVAIGAPLFDSAGRADRGRVTVHYGSSAGLATTPGRTYSGERAHDHFGSALAVGDFNADGYADLALSAPDFDVFAGRAPAKAGLGHNRGNSDEGRTYVFLGAPSGLGLVAQRVITGIQPAARGGSALAAPGDVNGDGFDELLIASPGANDRRGGVYLFVGSSTGLGALAWSRYGDESGYGDSVGEVHFSVGPAGDFNQDGFADFGIVEPANSFCGRILLFAGSASGPSAAPVGLETGVHLGPAGDFDHDGLSEYAFAARSGYPGCFTEGFQVLRREVGSFSTFFAETTRFPALALGDVNQDGLDDLVFSDPGFVHGPFLGRVNVEAGALYDGDQVEAEFGAALALADVDGDGSSELVIGIPRQDAGEIDEGTVSVVSGWSLGSLAFLEALPESPLAAGDFNADGKDDLVSISGTRVRVRNGTSAGLSAYQELLLGGPVEGGASVGDVNGDGYPDLEVTTEASFSNVRSATFHGSPTGIGVTQDLLVLSGGRGAAEIVGDVNADGYDDLLSLRPGLGDELYFGSAAGLVTPAQQVLAPATAHLDGIWNDPIHALDFDGDVFQDVVVARTFTSGSTQHVILELYIGSSTGLSSSEVLSAPELSAVPSSVVSLLTIRDLDFDGAFEVQVLTLLEPLLFDLVSGGLERTHAWWETSNFNAQADLDGDGYLDLFKPSGVHRGGPGGFAREPTWSLGLGSSGVQAADFDGDGLRNLLSHDNLNGLTIHEVGP